MNFFINKGATLPILKMELIQDGRNEYKDFHEKVQNAVITFSMYDATTGVKKIAMRPATCMVKPLSCPDDDEEYYISYAWREQDTNKSGSYKGTFHIEFLDGTGTLIVPIREELDIHILDGTTIKR